jgi:hypothetical protein
MKRLDSTLFVLGLMILGCSATPNAAQAGTPPSGSPAAPVISTAALVSAGMTHVLASVPAQSGATYQWSVTGGRIPGVRTNAAVYYDAPTGGTITLTCNIARGGGAAAASRTVPVLPAMPLTPAFYGSGFSADSLANTVVGGPSGNVVSYRFQARYTTPLRAFRVFFIWSATHSGYGAGVGGVMRADLMADDGTAAHLPKGPVLASTTYGPVITHQDFYPEIRFPQPVALKGGGLYHLVFTDVDADPVANYVSLDTLYTDAQTAPMQPVIADAAFAVLFRTASGPWTLRQGYTPTLELDFDTGSQGNGYMEVWSTNPKTISGRASVRESFKVTGPTRVFSTVLVRVKRVAGSGPIALRLEEANGAVVAETEVGGGTVPSGVSTWLTAHFPVSYALHTGIAYRLVLSCDAGTVYSAFPIRKGLDKGFSTSTVFPDGHAEFTTTAPDGWAGWDMWGTPRLTTSDLQFAFVP